MFSYGGSLNWPHMPLAVACAYERKYMARPLYYARRWARLDALGLMPADPGAEVYEAAESTVRTFYSDELWFEGEGEVPPIRCYVSSVTGQDWLDINLADLGPQTLQGWKDVPNYEYPPGAWFSSTHHQIALTWALWRMHQLYCIETVQESLEFNWHQNNALPVV